MLPSWGTECTDGGPVRWGAFLVRAAVDVAVVVVVAAVAFAFAVAVSAAAAAVVLVEIALQLLALLVRMCRFDAVGFSLHWILCEILSPAWW